ncbi:MAG: hypothetical protein K9M57_11225 [Phycisphaerae bacterium]|nr:hypothetical protein [Phycisphaerae bacterium]
MRLHLKNLCILALGALTLLWAGNSLDAQVVSNNVTYGAASGNALTSGRGSSTLSNFRQYSTGAPNVSSGRYGQSSLFNYNMKPRRQMRSRPKVGDNMLRGRLNSRTAGQKKSSLLNTARFSSRRTPGLLDDSIFKPQNLASRTIDGNPAASYRNKGMGWHPVRNRKARPFDLDSSSRAGNNRAGLTGVRALASADGVSVGDRRRGLSQVRSNSYGLGSLLARSYLTGK